MALSLVVRLTFLTLGLVSLLIAGGQMLPQAPPDLAAYEQLFMTSAACDTPCLMGIRQGMLLDDAAELLEAHDWVERVYTRRVSQFESRAFWIWSGKQPDFINPENRGFLYARSGESHDIRQRVYQVQVITSLRFQDIFLALGDTSDGFVQYWPQLDMITYDVRYDNPEAQNHVSLYTRVECPAQLANFYWHAHTSISQIFGSPLDHYVPPQDLSSLCRSKGERTAYTSVGDLDE